MENHQVGCLIQRFGGYSGLGTGEWWYAAAPSSFKPHRLLAQVTLSRLWETAPESR